MQIERGGGEEGRGGEKEDREGGKRGREEGERRRRAGPAQVLACIDRSEGKRRRQFLWEKEEVYLRVKYCKLLKGTERGTQSMRKCL